MKAKDITPEDMEIEKWDLVKELATEEDIIDYLATAFEDMSDKNYIRHAICTAMKAIDAHHLNMEASPAIASAPPLPFVS